MSNSLIIIIVIIILIIISCIYFVYNQAQYKIVSTVERFMEDSNIQENTDIFYNNDKNKILLDVANRGNLALGEHYMQGNWHSPDLFNLFVKIINNKKNYGGNGSNYFKYFTGLANQTNSEEMINSHYNLGNDFFESWLDKNMQYSCAYWNKDNMTLDEAQIQKMDLIGKKLKLEPGMLVLDIGFGWGSLANHLATKFNVKVIGINLSSEQYNYALEKYGNNNNVQYIYGDFADILKYNYKFDRIVSVGFYEHLDNDRYGDFYNIVATCMKEDGICLLHTIGTDSNNKGTEEWINKYIFTRGRIPNLCDISQNTAKFDLTIEDVHNFGYNYYKTLIAWYNRFKKTHDKNKNPVFHRMWEYYLLSCAAGFYTKHLYLWQFIITKRNKKEIYYGVR